MLLRIWLSTTYSRRGLSDSHGASAASFAPVAEWAEAPPASQGVDPQILADMHHRIDLRGLAYDSILIVRNGYLIHEWYADGVTEADLHALFSATKSINSLLCALGNSASG